MKKVVVVGIRNSYRVDIEEYLSDNYEIVAYSDLERDKLDSKHINFRPLLSVEEIEQVAFDYILIAYRNVEIARKVKEILVSDKKISSDIIIEFYKWANIEFPGVLEVWRTSQKEVAYDGIIVGMSHAVVGIDVNYFEHKIYGGIWQCRR